MRSLALAGFAALVLSASAGCTQQGELPDAPPPVGGDSGTSVEAPQPSAGDAQKKVSGEGGPAAPEAG